MKLRLAWLSIDVAFAGAMMAAIKANGGSLTLALFCASLAMIYNIVGFIQGRSS